MNELDLSNTQAVIFMMVLIGILLYLNHRDRKKSAQFEQGKTSILRFFFLHTARNIMHLALQFAVFSLAFCCI